MFFLYSLLLTTAFVILSPLLVIRSGKYLSGLKQRFGFYPKFNAHGKKVIWLHCVSVGETNAAKPLVDALIREFPQHAVIISNTTKTGHKLASQIYAEKAAAIFYFPFDWRFSVRRALKHFSPVMVLMMETEIWPRFFRETHHSKAVLAIVNGRMSDRSYRRYAYIRKFMRRVLSYTDAALMQGNNDAKNIMSLGIRGSKVRVTGNLKFDQEKVHDAALTAMLAKRFAADDNAKIVLAASTHDPEEKLLLAAFEQVKAEYRDARLMIAPRHPERFDEVWKQTSRTSFSVARRSGTAKPSDADAEIVLLDSVGELRSVYPLAQIVFVGGSLIKHGGQSILEPAVSGRAIVTGPHTFNFADAIKEFTAKEAIIVIPEQPKENYSDEIAREISALFADDDRRKNLGSNAMQVMDQNRGAAEKTVSLLKTYLNQ